MTITVIFKGKTFDDKYHWENVADALPKQVVSVKNKILSSVFPKVNQQYIIQYSRLEGNELIDPYSISDYYVTCGYWKIVGDDFVFKKGVNKGFTVREIASAFPYNPELEKSFVKTLVTIYRKSNNVYTRNNVIRIFNSGLIKYCEVFGYGTDGIIMIGNQKNLDIKTVTANNYLAVRNRLEYYQSRFISPITFNNCANWIQYLDKKFKK